VAITFVAAASASSTSNTASATVNKPSGVTTGDVLVFVVVAAPNTSTSPTFTAPSGWTKQSTVTITGFSACIMSKIATGSEPSNYTATWNTTPQGWYGGISAYRGATGLFVAKSGATENYGGSSPISTPTVNNTKSGSWRLAFGAGQVNSNVNGGAPGAPSINETSRRWGGTSWLLVETYGNGDTEHLSAQFYDSNGSIATGNTNRVFSSSGVSFWAGIAWIGILEAGTATPASGTMGLTLKRVTASGSGAVINNATMSTTLPMISMTGTAYGAPPDVDGPISATLPQVSPSINGLTDVRGTLDTIYAPVINIQAETRVFGIRVITVEDDTSRRIIVPSRGVDD
jgi:hypothetical protein